MNRARISALERSRMHLTRLACAVVTLLAVGSAAAQEEASDLAGHRVRLGVSGMKQPLVGNVVTVGDLLLIARGEASGTYAKVPWADVKRLQVSRGKEGNMLIGLLGGAAAWGAVVGLTATFDTLDESGLSEPLLIGGFLVGGALVGSLIKTDVWQDLPVLRLGGASTRSGTGMRVQVAFSF